jgi:hypothetical protein
LRIYPNGTDSAVIDGSLYQDFASIDNFTWDVEPYEYTKSFHPMRTKWDIGQLSYNMIYN